MMKGIFANDEKLIKALKITVTVVIILEVALGFLGWLMGTHLYMYALTVTCLGGLSLTIFHGISMYGKRNVIIIIIIGMGISLLFESLGCNFGFLFSKYTYTGYIPGPKLFGFDVFSMIGYGCAAYELWALGQAAVGMFENRFKKWDVLVVPIISGLLFVSIDFGTDPLLATITGAYDWVQPGVYYGVPYQNYLGWIVMAICMMFCISLLLYPQQKKGMLPPTPSVAKKKWFWRAPVLIYGALFIQMPFYALITENQEVTVYSGQTFMTHDIYWGVCLVYMGAILVPSLIILARISRSVELED